MPRAAFFTITPSASIEEGYWRSQDPISLRGCPSLLERDGEFDARDLQCVGFPKHRPASRGANPGRLGVTSEVAHDRTLQRFTHELHTGRRAGTSQGCPRGSLAGRDIGACRLRIRGQALTDLFATATRMRSSSSGRRSQSSRLQSRTALAPSPRTNLPLLGSQTASKCVDRKPLASGMAKVPMPPEPPLIRADRRPKATGRMIGREDRVQCPIVRVSALIRVPPLLHNTGQHDRSTTLHRSMMQLQVKLKVTAATKGLAKRGGNGFRSWWANYARGGSSPLFGTKQRKGLRQTCVTHFTCAQSPLC